MTQRCLHSFLFLAASLASTGMLVAADASRPAVADAAPAPAAAAEPAPDQSQPASSDVNDQPRADFLHPGEVLVFRLSWGIFSNAGELRIETTEEETPEHGRRIRVRLHTKSRGLISAFFPVDSNADVWIDPATARPLLIERTGSEGGKETHTTTVYDYETFRVSHTDHNRPKRSGEADLPDEPAYDTFVVMMLARSWALKPGGTRKVTSSFEDDIYELKATALEEDTIKVPAGKFEVVEIELEQQGELKGFFKKGGTVRFFISKGENPQIVRIELRAKAGTFVMQLVEVEKQPPEKKSATAAPRR